jgi:hypothetical protein
MKINLQLSLRTVIGLIIVLLATTALLSLTGCNGGNSSSLTSGTGSLNNSNQPAGSQVVTTDYDMSKRVTWDEVKKFTKGTPLYMRVNLKDSKVLRSPVRYEGYEDSTPERLIVITTPADLISGSGFSGSPLETADGRIIGGLRYGVIGDGHSGLIAFVDDVIKAINDEGGTRATSPTTRSVMGKSYTLLPLVRYITGLSQQNVLRMRKPLPDGYQIVSSASDSRDATVPTGALIPGESVSINEISGPLMTGGAIGTFTCTYQGWMIFFSHAYAQEGNIASPVTRAKMVTTINSPTAGAMKEAVPYGPIIGTALTDRFNGVGVKTDPSLAKTYPVDVKVIINDGDQKSFRHMITKHKGNYTEEYFAEGAIFLPLDFVFDKIAGGTANGTLKISLADGTTKTEQITLPNPKNEYVSSDIVYETYSAVSDLITQNVNPGESPAGVELSVKLSDIIAPKLHARFWQDMGTYKTYYTPSATQIFYMTEGQTYQLQTWVDGWVSSDYQIVWSVDGDGRVAAKTEDGDSLKCLAGGEVTLTITATKAGQVLTRTFKIIVNSASLG